MLDALIGYSGRVARVATWFGGAAIMAAAFVVIVDVLSRQFLGWSMQGADELSGYLFAIATSWAFAFCLLQRANVRIDGLYLLAPTPLRAVMDIAALLALSAYVAALLHSGWVLWLDSYTYDSRSITSWRTPLAYPQGLWLIGWIWFALAILLLLARCIQYLLRGDLAGMTEVIGVRSLEEEVAEEVAHADVEVTHERQRWARGGEH